MRLSTNEALAMGLVFVRLKSLRETRQTFPEATVVTVLPNYRVGRDRFGGGPWGTHETFCSAASLTESSVGGALVPN